MLGQIGGSILAVDVSVPWHYQTLILIICTACLQRKTTPFTFNCMSLLHMKNVYNVCSVTLSNSFITSITVLHTPQQLFMTRAECNTLQFSCFL